MVDAGALPYPDSARSALERARERSAGDLGEAAATAIARVAGTSPILGRFLASHPDDAAAIAGDARRRAARLLLAAAREERGRHPGGPAGLAAALRRFRHRETARIALRDLEGAPVGSIAAELADVAQACLDLAVDDARSENAVPGRFAVLGMGKLGGRELNYSSDVDLIYAGEEADSPERFRNAADRITRALAEPTDDGIAFRVDLDLRPEGRAGPLVSSARGLELYYESYGATWERAAWLKARPIAGDLALGSRIVRALEPFVFRRWLDFATIEAIREMKERIDRSRGAKAAWTLLTGRAEPGWNVKLGTGGIREIEFFVQTLQLVNAGKHPEVRAGSTLEALRRLATAELVRPGDRTRLAAAYEFLRRLEHRLQLRELAQTHVLPEEAGELAALAVAMGYPRDPEPLLRDLAWHRAVVAEAFDGLFREKARRAEESIGPEAALLHDPDLDEERGRRLAASAGLFADPGAAADAFARIRRGPTRTRRREQAIRYLRRIASALFVELRVSPDADAAVRNLDRFLGKIGGRTTLLALLAEHPATVTLLVRLFGASDHLADAFIARPELIDALLGSGTDHPRARRAELRLRSREVVGAGADTEARLEAIRRFRTTELLRIAIADLWGGLDVRAVLRQLSDLADATVERCWEAVGGPQAGLVALALGRLGSREMAYGSDVDLVFVEEDETEQERNVRVAQRFLSALSAPMREGIAYRVDTRLRPSGSSGPLVVSRAALVRYHREHARTWERQAFVRARAVAGCRRTWRRARAELGPWIYRTGVSRAEVASEVAAMRGRVERELGAEGPDGRNVKTGRGGLADVEFAAQLLALTDGARNPFLRTPGSLAILRRAAREGLLAEDVHRSLRDGYLFLAHLENRLRIVTGRPEDDVRDDDDAWRALDRRARPTTADRPGRALRAEYDETTARVRAAFRRVIGEGE